MRSRRGKTALSGRARPPIAQRPYITASQDQLLLRGYERDRWTLRVSSFSGVPVRIAAISGDRSALSGDVSRLWCSGCQQATCAFLSSRRHACKPTPDVHPRDPRFLKRYPSVPKCNVVRPLSPAGMDIVIERRGFQHAMASDFGLKSIPGTDRRHVRRPPRGGSPACRQCSPRWISRTHT